MPAKRVMAWQARNHNATIERQDAGFSYTVRHHGEFETGSHATLTEAKQACVEYVGQPIDWRTA